MSTWFGLVLLWHLTHYTHYYVYTRHSNHRWSLYEILFQQPKRIIWFLLLRWVNVVCKCLKGIVLNFLYIIHPTSSCSKTLAFSLSHHHFHLKNFTMLSQLNVHHNSLCILTLLRCFFSFSWFLIFWGRLFPIRHRSVKAFLIHRYSWLWCFLRSGIGLLLTIWF